ncbi:MAG TPA: class I SAM-dependent methyltransferase [candidate division Zixibacteria bacterium]|nr:class I SAM-dependent methyltransferase [candidate division Zixibacteria bacterium]
MNEIKRFYDTEYHFEEDIQKPDLGRLKGYFKHFEVHPGSSIVDIGCGSGLNLKFWEDKGLNMFGIDLSTKAIKIAKSIVPTANLLVGDGQNLPFKESSFDYATLLGVLEHFPEPARGLDELYRVLKPGGKVCFVVPNSFGKLGKLVGFSGTEQEQELLLTMNEWKKLIEDHGFKVYHIHRDRGPKIFKNYKIIRMFFRVLLILTLLLPKSFAYQFVIYASKNVKNPPHSDGVPEE